MIKILGLLKSFSFLIGAFMVPYFKNGKTEQMKGHFSNTRCPKKSTWPYFGKKKRDIKIWSKYLVPWKVLPFWIGTFVLPFLKKNGCTKLTQGHFNHTGCPKNKNGLTLEQNLRKKKMIKILSPLKSFAFFIWSICGAFWASWKVCLYDVVHCWCLFLKNGWTKLINGHFSYAGCPKK